MHFRSMNNALGRGDVALFNKGTQNLVSMENLNPDSHYPRRGLTNATVKNQRSIQFRKLHESCYGLISKNYTVFVVGTFVVSRMWSRYTSQTTAQQTRNGEYVVRERSSREQQRPQSNRAVVATIEPQ